MPQISIRPGDSLVVAEDIIIRFDGSSHLDIYDAYDEFAVVRGPELEPTEERIEAHLLELSKEIMNGLSSLEPSVRDGL